MSITVIPAPSSGGISSVVANNGLTGSIAGNVLTIGGPPGQVPISIPTCFNGTVWCDAEASFDYTIDSLRGLTVDSGTITLDIKINGVAVTGLSSIAVTSTPQDVSASGANTVSTGNIVTAVFSSNSNAKNLRFTMKLIKT